MGYLELLDGDCSDIVDLETFECEYARDVLIAQMLTYNLTLAPSEIIFFDDSNADANPISTSSADGSIDIEKTSYQGEETRPKRCLLCNG